MEKYIINDGSKNQKEIIVSKKTDIIEVLKKYCFNFNENESTDDYKRNFAKRFKKFYGKRMLWRNDLKFIEQLLDKKIIIKKEN